MKNSKAGKIVKQIKEYVSDKGLDAGIIKSINLKEILND